MHGHLVAGRAELASCERLEVDAGRVDVLAGTRFFGRRFDFEVVFAMNRVGDAVAADTAEDWREDVSRLNAAFTVRLAVHILDSMTGDARDAFAGHFRHVPQRLGARLAKGRGDRRVATHA